MMFTKRDQSQTVSFCGSSFYKMMSIGFSGTNLLHTNPKVDTAPAARKSSAIYSPVCDPGKMAERLRSFKHGFVGAAGAVVDTPVDTRPAPSAGAEESWDPHVR